MHVESKGFDIEKSRRMTYEKALDEGVFWYLSPNEQYLLSDVITGIKTRGELALELDKPLFFITKTENYAIRKLENLLVYGPRGLKSESYRRKHSNAMGRPRKEFNLEEARSLDGSIVRTYIAATQRVSPSTITRRLGVKQLHRPRNKG